MPCSAATGAAAAASAPALPAVSAAPSHAASACLSARLIEPDSIAVSRAGPSAGREDDCSAGQRRRAAPRLRRHGADIVLPKRAPRRCFVTDRAPGAPIR